MRYNVRFVSTLSKGQYFTINSFDIVAVFGNKVECCFDRVACCFNIVAGVDGAFFISVIGGWRFRVALTELGVSLR